MSGSIFTSIIASSLGCLMLMIAVSDWRSYRVPDALTALALGLRGLDIMIAPRILRGDILFDAFVRAATMASLFFLFRELYRRWRGREGLGLGDVKLAGVAGAWVHWQLLPYVVEMSAIFGLGLALFRARRARAAPRGDMKLPFAVGFAPAIFIGWWLGRVGF